MIPDEWLGAEVAVIGLGRSGVAAARWLADHGVAVYASDAAETPAVWVAARSLAAHRVAVDVGKHDVDRIRRAAGVVVSPGVPPDAPPLQAARDAGREIVAELDLAARVLETSRLIVVTGTNGKSTTTALVAHLLATSGIRAAAGGNIGRPLIDLASEAPPLDWVAVEASSFQLHDAPHLMPAVGVLTNLAPDHLDRYPDTAAYYADKRLLFRNATAESIWVLNQDDTAVLGLAGGVPGTCLGFSIARPADAWWDREADRLVLGAVPLLARAALPLLGEHNIANALAAALAAHAAGVGPAELSRALMTFRPLPHRLEPIREVAGVLWINDSKATNVAAAVRAVQAIPRPFVVIVGGHHKGETYVPLAQALPPHCRAVVAYGAARELLAAVVKGRCPVRSIDSFDDACREAGRLARAGDAVLLAPACASYDQFTNFEERGQRLRTYVEALCGQ